MGLRAIADEPTIPRRCRALDFDLVVEEGESVEVVFVCGVVGDGRAVAAGAVVEEGLRPPFHDVDVLGATGGGGGWGARGGDDDPVGLDGFYECGVGALGVGDETDVVARDFHCLR